MNSNTITVTSWPDNCSTLWNIAWFRYGSGEKWKLIYDTNREVMGTHLQPPIGSVLFLPPLNYEEELIQVSYE